MKTGLDLDYGRFAVVKDGSLDIDEDSIKRAFSSCRDLADVVAQFPFIGLDDEGSRLICDFCPSRTFVYYPDHHSHSSYR